VPPLVARLTAHTALKQEDVAVLETWAHRDLITDIDRAVSASAETQQELSQLLATTGVLPMFGFPTRVRNLLGRRVTRRRQLDDAVVSDRALHMAVSAFSPGAHLVKDGYLHIAAGFAAYEIRGPRAIPRDPLGASMRVGACDTCGALVKEPQTTQCSGCLAELRTFNLYQPLGFRTLYEHKDYEDEYAETATAGLPALTVSGGAQRTHDFEAIRLETYEQAQVLQINDNRGRLFPLRELGDGSIIVPDESLYPPHTWSNGPPSGTDRGEAAIGEVRTTDVLVVDLSRPNVPGGLVVLSRSILPAGPAAFWSLAEALRRACQVALDVDPQELVMGLQAVRVGGLPTARIFVADSLENGAGYATELGVPSTFQRILDDVREEFTERWHSEAHSMCTTSCPDCLRSYDNRRLHGALDWRLALDMLDLAAGLPLSADRWLKHGATVAQGFTRSAGGWLGHDLIEGLPVVVNKDTRRGVVLGHPLWRREADHYTDHQRRAVEVAQTNLGLSTVTMSDPYEVDRLPLAVLRKLL
jgi:DEAD/DEAH box helicase domain-containing protein